MQRNVEVLRHNYRMSGPYPNELDYTSEPEKVFVSFSEATEGEIREHMGLHQDVKLTIVPHRAWEAAAEPAPQAPDKEVEAACAAASAGQPKEPGSAKRSRLLFCIIPAGLLLVVLIALYIRGVFS